MLLYRDPDPRSQSARNGCDAMNPPRAIVLPKLGGFNANRGIHNARSKVISRSASFCLLNTVDAA